jgi:hypothetical protein
MQMALNTEFCSFTQKNVTATIEILNKERE